MSRRARLLRVAFVVALFAVLGVMIMPGRLWVGQNKAIAEAKVELASVKEEHAQLKKRVDRLGSAPLIEKEARAGFGWVHVGDELYTLTPAPPLKVELPDVWPFGRLRHTLEDVAKDG